MSPLSASFGPAYGRFEAVRQAGWRVIPGADLAVFEWLPWPTVPLLLQAGLDPFRQAEQIVTNIEEIRRLALGDPAAL